MHILLAAAGFEPTALQNYESEQICALATVATKLCSKLTSKSGNWT